jgi:hypothetical protein
VRIRALGGTPPGARQFYGPLWHGF